MQSIYYAYYLYILSVCRYVRSKINKTFSTPPILWCRYVDDTFCILDKWQTESFHQHLNSVCKHIQFTKEVEFESSLPFLDVLVSRSGNNISTQIHKKPTHTDRYLPYTSHHPKHQKLAITHSLHNRIFSHIADQTERQIARREVDLRHTLRANGYLCKYTYPPKTQITTWITYVHQIHITSIHSRNYRKD